MIRVSVFEGWVVSIEGRAGVFVGARLVVAVLGGGMVGPAESKRDAGSGATFVVAKGLVFSITRGRFFRKVGSTSQENLVGHVLTIDSPVPIQGFSVSSELVIIKPPLVIVR